MKFALSVVLAVAAAYGQTVDVPFEKFKLDNGLTVIVHTDRKAPIVAVNVWYHVGSKNEKAGKTGFAHLFEHLMFNGSEHFNTDYFKALEKIGATDLNGTTSSDRTNYFQNVPTTALDQVLFLEADRMGFLLGAIDKARLDEQRGVVQNEKRQGENQPYGKVFNLIYENSYPKGHPYSWPVIGSMEDLNAASLDDVKEWFKTYYGPTNAVVVLAGDIDAATAKEKMRKYFGDIPPGPPVAYHQSWAAKRSGEQRQRMEDRVPQARIYKVWNIPAQTAAEADLLEIAANVLGRGKNSRFYKRLVYDEQVATDIEVFPAGGEIGSLFMVIASARPGVELSKVEKSLDDEMARFLDQGPTASEMERVRNAWLSSFLKGVERVGGFGGKSDLLATGEVFYGNPAAYKDTVKIWETATPAQVKEVSRRWLSDGVYVLEVHPFAAYKESSGKLDRSKLPAMGAAPELRLPKVQRGTLSNGLKVVLGERHEIPVVRVRLLVDAGFAADQLAVPGTANLTMAMLDEGTATRTSLQISEEAERLGAELGTRASLDTLSVGLAALKKNLDASLDLFADVAIRPAFPQTDFERVRKNLLAAIQQEEVEPFSMALRVLPPLMFPTGHAYAQPLTGSGYAGPVSELTPAALKKFYETWFKPNHATLVVAGDTTLAEILPKLEKLFGGWKPGDVPKKNLSTVPQRAKPAVYLIDRPDSEQSVILAGHVSPPRNNPDDVAITVLNTLLGGQFTSRINMNLREDKHWSYGAGTIFFNATGQRPFVMFAPVQTDKTKESMVEIQKELRDIARSRPATAEELGFAQDNEVLSLAGSRETAAAVLNSMSETVTYGLPDNYYETYAGKVRALKPQDIATVAEKVIHPDNLVWVVVGDRAKIEKGIKELNLGEYKVIDASGKPVQ
ncbi:MAG: insulinase family protein [Bryobacterales bacterium]|nr:insulinase family protein [Bryobacterales bacterium]